MTTALLELVEGESKVCGRTGYRTRDLWLLSQTRTDYATRSGSVCVCEGYLYSHVSHGKFYFEKIIAIFSGEKLVHVRGKASIPFEWLSRRLYYPRASENWPTALRSPAVCVCVCTYTGMSPVGTSTLKKS